MARWSAQPVRVLEDADTGHRFVVYPTKNGLQADLRFDGDEPWFTQLQIAEIFGVDVKTANHHILKFQEDGELDPSTIRKFEIVRQEGSRTVNRAIEHYGLDEAFYVGYRVNSTEGKLFRRCATNMLVQLATKGFIVDVTRLKEPDAQDRVAEPSVNSVRFQTDPLPKFDMIRFFTENFSQQPKLTSRTVGYSPF